MCAALAVCPSATARRERLIQQNRCFAAIFIDVLKTLYLLCDLVLRRTGGPRRLTPVMHGTYSP
jgi:hypothetical protein